MRVRFYMLISGTIEQRALYVAFVHPEAGEGLADRRGMQLLCWA